MDRSGTSWALEVEDLTVAYADQPVLWDVDLQVPTGYSSWLLRRYAAYTRLIPSETAGEIEVYFTDCAHPLLNALNPEFVYAPAAYALQGAGGEEQRLSRRRPSFL